MVLRLTGGSRVTHAVSPSFLSHLPCWRSCLRPLLLPAAWEVMLAAGVLLVATSAAVGERAAPGSGTCHARGASGIFNVQCSDKWTDLRGKCWIFRLRLGSRLDTPS